MSKSETPSYPQRRFSGFYNAMMKVRNFLKPMCRKFQQTVACQIIRRTLLDLYQPDDDISDTDEDMSIAELIESFDEILKIEIEELSEHVPQRNRRSSWYLLKLISRKLKNDTNSIIEAARLNMHILTLNFLIKLLPTAENDVSGNLLSCCDHH